jgi:hypothetical protein
VAGAALGGCWHPPWASSPLVSWSCVWSSCVLGGRGPWVSPKGHCVMGCVLQKTRRWVVAVGSQQAGCLMGVGAVKAGAGRGHLTTEQWSLLCPVMSLTTTNWATSTNGSLWCGGGPRVGDRDRDHALALKMCRQLREPFGWAGGGAQHTVVTHSRRQQAHGCCPARHGARGVIRCAWLVCASAMPGVAQGLAATPLLGAGSNSSSSSTCTPARWRGGMYISPACLYP